MKTPFVSYTNAPLLTALGILLWQETVLDLGRLAAQGVLPVLVALAALCLFFRVARATIRRIVAKQPEPNLMGVSQTAHCHRTRHTKRANECFRERQDLQRHRNLIICMKDGTLIAVEKAVKACQAAECLHRIAANRLLALQYLIADIERERRLLGSAAEEAVGADVEQATALESAIREAALILNSISDVQQVKCAGQANIQQAISQLRSSRLMAETHKMVESGRCFDVMTLEEEAGIMEEAELIAANMRQLDFLDLELLASELHEEDLV